MKHFWIVVLIIPSLLIALFIILLIVITGDKDLCLRVANSRLVAWIDKKTNDPIKETEL